MSARRRTVATPAPLAEIKRAAIYTRKSTNIGLEQEFNSLDAQREACEQYIRSQAVLGWQLIPAEYSDGGYSGANIQRPAFQRLMQDLEARKIEIVVVHRVDRLSRSLLDFATLMDRFNRASVAFVSVTQNFSTADAMGRLTLNVLMSFAEFERTMIGERTRDKMSAARRKGKWMGGPPPLGYDVVDRKLVVNEYPLHRPRLSERRP
jgi:DNA invertase Pin-like site-specific DNA recombinase